MLSRSPTYLRTSWASSFEDLVVAQDPLRHERSHAMGDSHLMAAGAGEEGVERELSG